MSSGSRSKSEGLLLPKAVERYFEVALYLMVLSGFATLAQTGQLDPLTVLLVVGALVVRGYLLARQQTFILTEPWTRNLTLAFAAWYVVDFFIISHSFVTATVHLVLALMVVRLFSARRNRDYVFLAILSFLQVLASSVLTVDATFLVAFACFMLATVATFILLEMRRSSAAAAVHAREFPDPAGQHRLGLSLAGVTPALVFFILVIAIAIFFLLPRISAGYLSAYAPTGELATGFSDRVELGRIGEIQQSSTVVMHILIEGDKGGAYDLKWRGIALSVFDGRNWSSPQKQVVVPRLPDGRFVLPVFDPRQPRGWQKPVSSRSHPIHYRVLLEPVGTNVFFLAPKAEAVEGNYRMITTDEGNAVYDLDRDQPLGLYEADSDISRPGPEELRAVSSDTASDYWKRYLQLPALDARIPELARQVTARATSNYDKAVAIERYLNTTYGYTLQLGQKAPKDPLAYFLFERKQGHCEYFASSMAVMLRSLHIPARIVNGFRTGEFNDVNSQYVVRARNAHSWVEVYFPGHGWVSFDPTPAAMLETRSGLSRILLYLDAASSFWREWVINYDFGHQKVLGREATRTTHQWFGGVKHWGSNRYEGLLSYARRIRARMVRSPRAWTVGGILAVILLVLGIKVRAIWRMVRSRRVAAHPEKAPQMAATIWYRRMTRRVARRGWRKSPVQTPSEFVTAIGDDGLRRRVAQFTEHYENARFGDSAEDARQLPELYEEISSAGTKTS